MGQVAKDLLREWTIYRMGTPAGTGSALGQPEAWAYVLKARALSEQQSSFEQDALQRSCSNVVEVSAKLSSGDDRNIGNLAAECLHLLFWVYRLQQGMQSCS
jgi:hypothetical protein